MPDDVWVTGGAYEAYVGRWSRLVARAFLDWLAPAPRQRWLDMGCGTGALSATILAAAEPSEVRGVDASPGFVAHARAAVADPRAGFEVADARSLPFPAARFDMAVSGLVLNFVPEHERALAELARVTVPGGQIAAYVWDYAAGMALMRAFWDEAAALDPAAAELDEGPRFPICQPEALGDLWQATGLLDVATTAIDVPTVFTSFDDYWDPFLGGQGPAPGYAVSLEPSRQAALRERLRERLAARPDGSIHLTARAWAVRGRLPG